MCDDWMPVIRLPLTLDQFHQLPRNSAYKYEYFHGEAVLSPRPRYYHAVLDLGPPAAHEPVALAPLRDEDFEPLVRLFTGSFRSRQPLGSLDEATRLEAARQLLERTRTGGDGPLVRRASFVAREEERLVGSIWVTLLPEGDPTDWDSYYWRDPPPPDLLEQRRGRPHLTWIFVSPLLVGHGVGTALLAASVRALLDLGYRQLFTTFLLGNESSMLWHWRQGFRLLPYPGSFRLMRQRWGKRAK